MASKNLHVMMLPWFSFGHLTPFFELSVALAKAGVRVSFLSNPRIIQRMPSVLPNRNLSIEFVTIPFPPTKNGLLPDNAVTTYDVSFENIQYLKSAYDDSQFAIDKLVSERSPDYLIVDVVPYWVTDIARKHSVPLVLFTVCSAATDTFWGAPEHLAGEGRSMVRLEPDSLMCQPDWVTFPSSLRLKKHEAAATFPALYGSNGTFMSDANRRAKLLEECEAVLVRSCQEFEGEYLDLFRNMIGKPVIPAGLLPPAATGRTIGLGYEWLGNQKPKSLVYVGFGSECKLSIEQTHEIAHALELSELPFVWALRKPEGAAEAMEHHLPEGFRDRTAERGKTVVGWVPPVDILAYPAFGGALFHGGWGSAIEMLQFGHRLVVMPFLLDQALHARLLVEKELAVEVEAGEDGLFARESICKALRRAMESEDGEKLQAKATEAAQVFGDRKLHESYIGSLIEYLKKGAASQHP